MMVVHLIKLPTTLYANRFEEFAKTSYLQAIHDGSSRVGQVLGARVLRRRRLNQGEGEDLGQEFLLLVDFDGVEARLPRIDDTAVENAFNAFGAIVTEMGAFDEVASRLMASTCLTIGSGRRHGTVSIRPRVVAWSVHMSPQLQQYRLFNRFDLVTTSLGLRPELLSRWRRSRLCCFEMPPLADEEDRCLIMT